MKLKVLELVIFHKAKSLSLAYSKVIKWVTFILSVKYIRNSHMYGEIKKNGLQKNKRHENYEVL